MYNYDDSYIFLRNYPDYYVGDYLSIYSPFERDKIIKIAKDEPSFSNYPYWREEIIY